MPLSCAISRYLVAVYRSGPCVRAGMPDLDLGCAATGEFVS
jgi:hypothetical protein